MKTWDNLTKLQKVLGSIVIIIASIVAMWNYVYSGYDHFATKAYADNGDRVVQLASAEGDESLAKELHDYQRQSVISDNRAEIWRAKREIKRLTRDLTATDLGPGERVLIEADIKEFEGLIDCIQDNKDLCY